VYPRTQRHHGHDIFLQTWFELGAVGVLLLALAGAIVVMLIPLLPSTAQPFAAGTFAALALVGALAWGHVANVVSMRCWVTAALPTRGRRGCQ
jgi:hypothetical protein